MGRGAFVARMALGRSPYEPTLEPPPPNLSYGDAAQTPPQAYDDTSRLTDASIENLKREQRDAQNDILALVGVVERKDESDRLEKFQRQRTQLRRTQILKEEHDSGELLDFVLTPVNYLARLWTNAFLQRFQIGFYHPSLSIADILLGEWRSVWRGGFRLSFASLFPAMGAFAAHVLIRLPLAVASEQITGRMQISIQKLRLSRTTTLKMFQAISLLNEMLLIAVDVALLPIEYYAFAQRLGLAPTLPLFPYWKFFSHPWDSASFHNFGWRPLTGLIFVRWFLSPASLLLIHELDNYDGEEDMSICGWLTSYRRPKFNEHNDLRGLVTQYQPPRLRSDPIGWIFDKCYVMRTAMLRWCGWTIWRDPNQRIEFEQDMVNHSTARTLIIDSDPIQYQRSTHLAHMPARHLINTIDTLFTRILTLPFESIMLRTIAYTYLRSPNPVLPSSQSLTAASHIFSPLNEGPIAQLLKSPSSLALWTYLGTYLSRLGLGLTLTVSVDIILYFVTYACTRHIGLSYCEWGKKTLGQESMFRASLRLMDRRPVTPPADDNATEIDEIYDS